MYKYEPHKYFSNVFRFLKYNDNNRISLWKTFYYIIVIFSIIIIGQIIAENLEPYKSNNIENEKFINAKIKRQIIVDTFSLPIQQSTFKSYFAIKLNDGLIYRLNLSNREIDGKIIKDVIIQKKAKDKKFEIINNNKISNFKVTELSNFGTKLFVFLASLFISFVGIPLWFKQNELEKENEKNNH